MIRTLRRPRLSPYKIASLVLSAGLVVFIVGLQVRRSSFPVLEAAGPVARAQQELLIKAFFLMLIIVIPVFTMTFGFAWRYRESNKSTYKPDWDHSRYAETVWWAVPTLLIVVLSVMTWRSTFALDPYKPLANRQDTLHVQVIAMNWRWLFIYPDQGVASLNELYLPVNKAVQFDITSDAPMNSFWIPQLAGQVYAMPGMGTRLHLEADKTGTYIGRSANISGRGFSGMTFKTKVTDQARFNDWVSMASNQAGLTHQGYDSLSRPSTNKTVTAYGQPDHDLFEDIIGKYGHLNHHGYVGEAVR